MPISFSCVEECLALRDLRRLRSLYPPTPDGLVCIVFLDDIEEKAESMIASLEEGEEKEQWKYELCSILKRWGDAELTEDVGILLY